MDSLEAMKNPFDQLPFWVDRIEVTTSGMEEYCHYL
jgi:hypothetical protein